MVKVSCKTIRSRSWTTIRICGSCKSEPKEILAAPLHCFPLSLLDLFVWQVDSLPASASIGWFGGRLGHLTTFKSKIFSTYFVLSTVAPIFATSCRSALYDSLPSLPTHTSWHCPPPPPHVENGNLEYMCWLLHAGSILLCRPASISIFRTCPLCQGALNWTRDQWGDQEIA